MWHFLPVAGLLSGHSLSSVHLSSLFFQFSLIACKTQHGECIMCCTHVIYLNWYVICTAPVYLQPWNVAFTLVLLNCLWVFFIQLKLELLMQFPASNDEKIILLMKYRHLPNWIIWLTELLPLNNVTHFSGILFNFFENVPKRSQGLISGQQ